MNANHADGLKRIASEYSLGLTDDTGERVTIIDEINWEVPER